MPLAFPQPVAPPSAIGTTIFITAAVVASLASAAILLWPKRKPRLGDGTAWVMLGFFVTVSYCSVMSDVESKTKNLQFCLLIWGAVAALYGVNLFRLASLHGVWCGIESTIITCVALIFLSGIFAPTIEMPREEARQVQCRNNLKQIAAALSNYQDRHQKLPAHASGDPPHSWRVDLLPYLDQTELYDRYQFEAAWNDSANLEIAQTRVWPYICSSYAQRDDEQGRFYASYFLLTGPDTHWPAGGPLRWDVLPTGKSQTAIAVEACGQQIVWTEPRDIDAASTPIAINLPGKGPDDSPAMFSSFHSNGVHVLMTDGSVRRILLHTDPQVLKAMITRNGE